MSTKKQIPAKYRTRKTTPEQEKEINNIQAEMKKKDPTASYMAAKHEFFEKLEAENPVEDKKNKEPVDDKEQKTEHTRKKGMTIDETKLGVTMVLSKEDCKYLGFDTKKTTTPDAIRAIRLMLNLKIKIRHDKKE